MLVQARALGLVVAGALSAWSLQGAHVLTNLDAAALQEAVEKGGLVQVAVDGVIPLAQTLLVTANTTVEATGHVVTLDGGKRLRHFIVASGATLRLINLTLANGRYAGVGGQTNQPGMPGCGGAIYSNGGAVELTGCALVDNEAVGGKGGPEELVPGNQARLRGLEGGAAYGGAVYSCAGQLSITNCMFAGNRAVGGNGEVALVLYTGGGGDALGGALYSSNDVVGISTAVFTNNVARGGEPSWGRPEAGGGCAYGGALATEAGSVTLTDCQLSGNQTLGTIRVGVDRTKETGMAKGGGLFHGSGAMKIENTSFESNTAAGDYGGTRQGFDPKSGDGKGGAIFSQGALVLASCAVVRNLAKGGDASPRSLWNTWGGVGAGGGIASQGPLAFVNCTLAGNVAKGGASNGVLTFPGAAFGGGIFADGASVSLLNVTFAENRAQAEIASEGYGASIARADGSVVCTNTILASVPGETNIWGQISDGGHNISSDESARFSAPSSRNGLDPALGPLAYYGGATPTLPLLPQSPAIDAGDDAACPGSDQRGVARPKGSGCDIGAFELAPALKLTGGDGEVRVEYFFRSSQTCEVSVSADLAHWTSLGSRVANAEGSFEIERVDPSKAPRRFYAIKNAAEPGAP